MEPTNFVGRKFGRLLVLAFIGKRRYGTSKPQQIYNCLCDCGVEIEVPRSSLTSALTQSCGCVPLRRSQKRRIAGELMKMFLTLALAFMFVLPLAGTNRPIKGGPCCLCMCRSANQDKCAMYCVRRQHGKKIVELPAMKVCTAQCQRKHVVQLPPDYGDK
jgi:hypothetical protein